MVETKLKKNSEIFIINNNNNSGAMPFRRANLFAEIVVAIEMKEINSVHVWGEERGVICSCDCRFNKVLLVEQIIEFFR